MDESISFKRCLIIIIRIINEAATRKNKNLLKIAKIIYFNYRRSIRKAFHCEKNTKNIHFFPGMNFCPREIAYISLENCTWTADFTYLFWYKTWRLRFLSIKFEWKISFRKNIDGIEFNFWKKLQGMKILLQMKLFDIVIIWARLFMFDNV